MCSQDCEFRRILGLGGVQCWRLRAPGVGSSKHLGCGDWDSTPTKFHNAKKDHIRTGCYKGHCRSMCVCSGLLNPKP